MFYRVIKITLKNERTNITTTLSFESPRLNVRFAATLELSFLQFAGYTCCHFGNSTQTKSENESFKYRNTWKFWRVERERKCPKPVSYHRCTKAPHIELGSEIRTSIKRS